MRTLFLAGLVAGLLTAAAPAASAHPDHDYRGRCGFAAVAEPGGDGPETRWTGYADVVVVATNATGDPAPDALVSVRCVLVVDDVERATVLAASGTAVAAGATTLVYEAALDATVNLCTAVTVGGEEHVHCPPVGSGSMEEGLQNLIDDVFELADDTICPALVAAAPGVPGVVDIEADGDTYVAGEWFWDCPPYGT